MNMMIESMSYMNDEQERPTDGASYRGAMAHLKK